MLLEKNLVVIDETTGGGVIVVKYLLTGDKTAGSGVLVEGGLLDISTARYFYKVFKTILHKPTTIEAYLVTGGESARSGVLVEMLLICQWQDCF